LPWCLQRHSVENHFPDRASIISRAWPGEGLPLVYERQFEEENDRLDDDRVYRWRGQLANTRPRMPEFFDGELVYGKLRILLRDDVFAI